jgi:hypothetical protein
LGLGFDVKSKGKVAAHYVREAIELDKQAARFVVRRDADWSKIYAKESEQAFVRGLIAFLHMVKPRKRRRHGVRV